MESCACTATTSRLPSTGYSRLSGLLQGLMLALAAKRGYGYNKQAVRWICLGGGGVGFQCESNYFKRRFAASPRYFRRHAL